MHCTTPGPGAPGGLDQPSRPGVPGDRAEAHGVTSARGSRSTAPRSPQLARGSLIFELGKVLDGWRLPRPFSLVQRPRAGAKKRWGRWVEESQERPREGGGLALAVRSRAPVESKWQPFGGFETFLSLIGLGSGGLQNNEYRTARVAEVLSDFRTLQYYIAAAPVDPENAEDYYTEGWAALRQCSLDGQYILECAADTTVPSGLGGEHEQTKAELKQVLLDAYARRHEGQKIYLRQAAAQRWVEYRQQVLQGGQPMSQHQPQLRACDHQLRQELAAVTDEVIYTELQASDQCMGRWTAEDPSLRRVLHWLRARRQ
ncbi:hypothetical protein G7046_g1114 [Stylonectria norvegica]|nr:hypothetical protein G7046_g1114 [Stylonectria norvegica]